VSDRLSDWSVGAITRRRSGTVSVGLAKRLAQEVQASRKLIADLRALHWMVDSSLTGQYCAECQDDAYPCPTIRLIEEAGL